MRDDAGALKPFRDFAGASGDYYADVFLKIQSAATSWTRAMWPRSGSRATWIR